MVAKWAVSHRLRWMRISEVYIYLNVAVIVKHSCLHDHFPPYLLWVLKLGIGVGNAWFYLKKRT